MAAAATSELDYNLESDHKLSRFARLMEWVVGYFQFFGGNQAESNQVEINDEDFYESFNVSMEVRALQPRCKTVRSFRPFRQDPREEVFNLAIHGLAMNRSSEDTRKTEIDTPKILLKMELTTSIDEEFDARWIDLPNKDNTQANRFVLQDYLDCSSSSRSRDFSLRDEKAFQNQATMRFRAIKKPVARKDRVGGKTIRST